MVFMLFQWGNNMARTTYGKTFRTRRGRLGRYKYVNGRRVSFVSKKFHRKHRTGKGYLFRGSGRKQYKRF